MKLLSIAIALISSDIAQGFSPANHQSLSLSHALLPSKHPTHSQYTKRNLFKNAQNGEESGVNEFVSNACGMFLSAFVVTSATFASSALPAQAEASPTTSGVDTPKSALVIDSTGTSGDRIFKAELDTKSLLKTVFVNKDKLAESLKSVSGVIDSELHKKEWLEIQKELLDIEGDIAPQIKVQGPKNLKAALDELSKGKVSIVVNGELVTIDVEEVRGAQSGDEEITIHIKGTKLAGGSSATEQSTPGSGLKAIADFFGLELQEQKESKILSFLGEPSGINSYLPSGSSLFLTNGEVIGGGLATVIGSTYLVSYQYYLNSIREAEEAAKRKSDELAKKKAKLAAKKKKEEQKEKEIEKEPEKAEDPPAPIPETENENEKVIPEAQTEELVAEDQVDVSTDPVSKSEPEPEPEPEPESQSSKEEQEKPSVDEEEVEESPKKERTLRKLKRKGKDSLRKLFGRE